MQLTIFNTLSREKEIFSWARNSDWVVRIYSCGPTVYWDPHVWNLRAFWMAGILWDTIRNILNLKLKHVMNITDVWHLTSDEDSWEDKMEKGSRREWLSAWDIAKKYENNFLKYLKDLNIYFDANPRATDYIANQIEIVSMLEEKWYTYEIENDWIYMDTSQVKDYWKLLWPNYKKALEWNNSGARVSSDWKKNPSDFALRKFSPKDEKRQMEWNSPWWVGFPGWHIECNAMSRALLWDYLDFHTGWVDHIPVHHSDEIVQAECSYASFGDENWQSKWVNYWLHCQFLNIEWAKISKSLWNDFSIPTIVEKWFSPLDLRYFFFQAHYRNFQDFSWSALEAAKTARFWLKKRIHELRNQFDIYDFSDQKTWTDFEKLAKIILDDLNTPKLLSEIFKLIQNPTRQTLIDLYFLEQKILRLWIFDPENNISNENVIPKEILDLGQARADAKAQKDYSLADEIRRQIENKGYSVKDAKQGYEIQKIS